MQTFNHVFLVPSRRDKSLAMLSASSSSRGRGGGGSNLTLTGGGGGSLDSIGTDKLETKEKHPQGYLFFEFGEMLLLLLRLDHRNSHGQKHTTRASQEFNRKHCRSTLQDLSARNKKDRTLSKTCTADKSDLSGM